MDQIVFDTCSGTVTTPQQIEWEDFGISQIAASVRDIALFVGGAVYPGYSNLVDMYNPSADSWTVAAE